MEEQEAVGEPEQEMGGIEFCSFGACQESNWEQYDEHNVLWRKYNLDTGAAVTVLPPSMAGEGEAKGPKRSFKTASGEYAEGCDDIQTEGRGEDGIPRRLTGSIALVHKPRVRTGGEYSCTFATFSESTV